MYIIRCDDDDGNNDDNDEDSNNLLLVIHFNRFFDSMFYIPIKWKPQYYNDVKNVFWSGMSHLWLLKQNSQQPSINT